MLLSYLPIQIRKLLVASTRRACQVLLLVSLLSLNACVSQVMTGAQVFYDRHNIKKTLSDHSLHTAICRQLFHESKAFNEGAHIDVVVFNKDVLLVGQVKNQQQKQLANKMVSQIPRVRRLFNELSIAPKAPFSQSLKDAFITASIRTKMLKDDRINQKAFKIVTENGVVFLLGDVKRVQSEVVEHIAQNTGGVKKIVRVMRYYTFNEAKHAA